MWSEKLQSLIPEDQTNSLENCGFKGVTGELYFHHITIVIASIGFNYGTIQLQNCCH
jgi:hypothetical protein